MELHTNKNKISYLNCKWYIENGKCKMPSTNSKFSKCISMVTVDPFCEWLIDFLNIEDNYDIDDINLPEALKLDVDTDENVASDIIQVLSSLV